MEGENLNKEIAVTKKNPKEIIKLKNTVIETKTLLIDSIAEWRYPVMDKYPHSLLQ